MKQKPVLLISIYNIPFAWLDSDFDYHISQENIDLQSFFYGPLRCLGIIWIIFTLTIIPHTS